MFKLIVALAAFLFAHVAAAVVNINTAGKDEFVALPGIGPAKAQAIVDYRNQHGPFRSIDEMRKVKGIGEKLFLQIRSELAVSGVARGAAAPTAAKTEVRADPKAADPKADPRTAQRAPAASPGRDDKARK